MPLVQQLPRDESPGTHTSGVGRKQRGQLLCSAGHVLYRPQSLSSSGGWKEQSCTNSQLRHSDLYLYGGGFRCLCTMPLCRAQTHTAVKEAGKFPLPLRFWGTAPAVPVSVSAYPLPTPLLGWILTENTGTGTQSFSRYSSRSLTACTRIISASQHSLNKSFLKMQYG